MNHDKPTAFDTAGDTRAKGRIAETAAVRWLRREGYEIVETNFSTKVAEIDVIARDGDTLCFLEVKARRTADFGPAIAAVTPRKQQRIARAAALYLAANDWDGPCRFDVLGMDRSDDEWEYTLIRDAFYASA